MKRLLCTLALMAAATSAVARDTSLKMDGIAAGSFVTRKGLASQVSMVFQGLGPLGYVINLAFGTAPTAEQARHSIRDVNGNLLRQVIPDRQITTCHPHTCERVTDPANTPKRPSTGARTCCASPFPPLTATPMICSHSGQTERAT